MAAKNPTFMTGIPELLVLRLPIVRCTSLTSSPP
jgi:hypothetical protein